MSLTDAEFDKWSTRYCAVFNQKPEWVLNMMLEWRRVFRVGRFTYAELTNALDTMAMSPPAEYEKEPIRRLSAIVHASRANCRKEEKAKTEAYEDRHGKCNTCSYGRVTVPHPSCISHDGGFVKSDVGAGPVYYELAVYCSCGLGRFLDNEEEPYWQRKSKERGREIRPWTLERYEKFNPHWREQIAEKSAFEQALVIAQGRRANPRQIVADVAKATVLPFEPDPDKRRNQELEEATVS